MYLVYFLHHLFLQIFLSLLYMLQFLQRNDLQYSYPSLTVLERRYSIFYSAILAFTSANPNYTR